MDTRRRSVFQHAPFLRLAALHATLGGRRVFTAEFDGACQEGGLFLLTMHPRIIGHRSRLPLQERLIAT